MTAAWIKPAVADIQAAYPSVFTSQQQDDVQPVATATAWLPQVVAQVLGAIGEGNRVPLSLTPGAVPPEAVLHVWALVAEKVIINSQRMVALIFTEGENGPLTRSLTEARSFVQKCRDGLNVTAPSDPDTVNLPLGVAWGDYYKPDGTASSRILDMTQDGDLLPPLPLPAPAPDYINYVGPPSQTPPTLQNIVVDVAGRQWQYYAGAWH